MATQPTVNAIDPAAEADQVAKLFFSLSQAIDEYRLNTPGITTEDQLRLRKRAQDLDDQAHRFTADAIGETLKAVKSDLAAIKAGTAEAKAQLAVLDSVAKVISVADAAFALGASISVGNPLGIIEATKSLTEAVAG
jgi:predicted transcriptional regulator